MQTHNTKNKEPRLPIDIKFRLVGRPF